MEREYIKIPKSSPIFDASLEPKVLNDEFWKNEIFHHLLSFYKNYDRIWLSKKIKQEKSKSKSDIEDLIAMYIRNYLRKNRTFGIKGLGLKVVGGLNNDIEKKGLYDISFLHSFWDKEFHFECKNLDKNQDLVNKYVCYNKGHSVFDGGVYRYFNGKYAQSLNFGGMIGFVLDGSVAEIKNKIIKKLSDKFDIAPEGDLVDVTNNSIEGNEFTFNSIHKRKNREFLIHHLLLNFV